VKYRGYAAENSIFLVDGHYFPATERPRLVRDEVASGGHPLPEPTRFRGRLLIQARLHAAQSFGGLREGGLLFEGEAVVARGVEGTPALLVDATEVEVRESI